MLVLIQTCKYTILSSLV